MIKAGISGGASPEAGELIRILINHPDVEIREIMATGYAGTPAREIHYGLIGETELKLTDRHNPENLDVLFICNKSGEMGNPEARYEEAVAGILESLTDYPELRLVDLTRSPFSRQNGFIFGLSEIYRKPLVRGAKYAYLPYPEESVSLIALYPLANRLLLSDDIEITIEAPEGLIDSERLNDSADNVAVHLREAQKSFEGKIRFILHESKEHEGLRIKIKLHTPLDYTHILEAYENIYDDHNFTFMTRTPVADVEVTGTHKCIISLRKSDNDTLEIDAVIDGKMRGGPGEAVHLMNLLFGLQERTGLMLRAIGSPKLNRNERK